MFLDFTARCCTNCDIGANIGGQGGSPVAMIMDRFLHIGDYRHWNVLPDKDIRENKIITMISPEVRIVSACWQLICSFCGKARYFVDSFHQKRDYGYYEQIGNELKLTGFRGGGSESQQLWSSREL